MRLTPGRLAAVSAAAYAVVSAVAASPPTPPERRAFLALNGDGHTSRLWLVPQQLGTPWLLPGLGAVGALVRRPGLAVAGALALPAEKLAEVGTKKVLRRPRPAQSVPGTELHDDAPQDGPSYPSGHVAIAACAVTLLAPEVGRLPVFLLTAAAGVSAGRRVQQGAHHPTDAVGGWLLGMALGSALVHVTSPLRSLRVGQGTWTW